MYLLRGRDFFFLLGPLLHEYMSARPGYPLESSVALCDKMKSLAYHSLRRRGSLLPALIVDVLSRRDMVTTEISPFISLYPCLCGGRRPRMQAWLSEIGFIF